MTFGYPFETKHVTPYRAALSEPEVIGSVAEGLRLNIYVTGGEVLGPAAGALSEGGVAWPVCRLPSCRSWGRGGRYVLHVGAQEIARAGSGGVAASLSSHAIGLPPIMRAGSPSLKDKVVPAVLSGQKVEALAITHHVRCH